MQPPRVLALDIGGTKMAAATVDGDGRILARDRIATSPTADADGLFAALVDMCAPLVRAVSPAAIGVGCGGPMRYPSGEVSPLNIHAWREFPLRQRLSDRFGLPTLVDNDAKALALGERWHGAGRGSRNMLGMVVSTGVGGGIILDGQLRHGQSGNAGHVGHIVVWPNGPPCGCGARGCLEAVASGSGLARRLNAALASRPRRDASTPADVASERGAALADALDPSWLAAHPEAVAATRLREGASAADIADAARHGEPLAAELLRSAGEGVGRGIASAAALLDLELVVIGGSIALKAWDLLAPPLFAEFGRSARLEFTRDVRVVQAGLGDDAGLLGARPTGPRPAGRLDGPEVRPTSRFVGWAPSALIKLLKQDWPRKVAQRISSHARLFGRLPGHSTANRGNAHQEKRAGRRKRAVTTDATVRRARCGTTSPRLR